MIELRSRIALLDVFTPTKERIEILEEVLGSRDFELIDHLLDQLDGIILDDEEYRSVFDLARDRTASEDVRARAAISLGPALELWEMERDDPFPMEGEEFTLDPKLAEEIHAGLLAIVRDEEEPKLVRRRALEAAVRCISDEHDRLIRRFWIDPDPEWRLTAIFAMGEYTFYEKDILAAVENDELAPVLRAEAFRSAAKLDLKKISRLAKKIAGDASQPEELRAGALKAYASLAPIKSQDLLERIAEEEEGDLQELARTLLDLLEEDPLGDW